VRQIENSAQDVLVARMMALRSIGHPAYSALYASARQLARRLLLWASAEYGALVYDRRGAAARQVLDEPDFEFLSLLLQLSERAAPQYRPHLDPFDGLGRPLGLGITVLPWSDSHVDGVKTAFDSLVAGRARPTVRIDKVCAEARIVAPSAAAGSSTDPLVVRCRENAVAALLKTAGLHLNGRWVFRDRVLAADVRRCLVADILEQADRSLHHTEIGLRLFKEGIANSFSWLRLSADLADDPSLFATDGYGLWQLRDKLGDKVEDRRPDHPDILPVMSAGELQANLDLLAATEQIAKEPLFTGLEPSAPEFADLAGASIREALENLPGEQRRSVGEVLLHVSDAEMLIAWLRSGMLSARAGSDSDQAMPLTETAPQGLTIIAATVTAMREQGSAGLGPWEMLKSACGERLSQALFNTLGAPRELVLWSFLAATHRFDLRHCFDFHGDVWIGLLGLQAGILSGDLGALPHWLSGQTAPVAVRHLIAPGPNYCPPVASLWNALLLFRRRTVGRNAIERVANCSAWWPSWTVDEACRAASEAIYRLGEPGPDQPSEPPVVPRPTPSEPRARTIPTRRLGLPPPTGAAIDPAKPLGDADVWLDFAKACFVMGLPDQIPLPPGPITLRTDTFRVGGTISGHGSVIWHSTENCFRFPLRGPYERMVSIGGRSGHQVSQSIRIWDHGEYLTLFNGAAEKPRPLDPFLVPLPRSRPLAFLMHDSLQPSEVADETERLNENFVLAFYDRGIPEGMTITLQEEVVWTAEHDAEDQQFVPEGEAILDLAGPPPLWGTPCDLRLTEAPPGFRPIRAHLGSQRLPSRESQGQWRFPGFLLLPGIEKFRRRGRVEGFLNDRRVVIPAVAQLGPYSIGAALRLSSGWRPVHADERFDRAIEGNGKLWLSLPDSESDGTWIIFEGPRPAAPYRSGGTVLRSHLFGFGEPLFAAPRRFNLTPQTTTIPLSGQVSDGGVVAGSDARGSTAILTLATAVAWTRQHQAVAWSAYGCRDVGPPDEGGAATEWRFPLDAAGADGIALFHGGEWLGTAMLAPNPKTATVAFICGARSWPESLLFAIDARLPILADEVRRAITARMTSDDGRAAVALCRLPSERARRHAASRLLDVWEPPKSIAEQLVTEFYTKAQAGLSAELGNLLSLAPCCGVKALALGSPRVPPKERASLLQLLLLAVLPEHIGSELGSVAAHRVFGEAESRLLARAVEGAGLDENFLASRAGASVGAIAWARLATGAGEAAVTPHINLETATTIDPVREWLAVHLLRRLTGL
jgi:hypothetical protein